MRLKIKIYLQKRINMENNLLVTRNEFGKLCMHSILCEKCLPLLLCIWTVNDKQTI